jgi:TRAP-type mannitol/chloroaromatic compound transport system permease small subunit
MARTFLRAVDRLSASVGVLVNWLLAAMILIGAFNAVARYVTRGTGLNLSSNAYIELQWYLFSLVFLLGAACVLRTDGHVRVDVLYSRLSARGQAWINTLGTLLFLIPFCVMMLWVSSPAVAASWRIREVSPDPGGLPRYPIKAVILAGFALLLLQGVAELVRAVGVLRGERRPGPATAGPHDPTAGGTA